jgi:hypothetical protein
MKTRSSKVWNKQQLQSLFDIKIRHKFNQSTVVVVTACTSACTTKVSEADLLLGPFGWKSILRHKTDHMTCKHGLAEIQHSHIWPSFSVPRRSSPSEQIMTATEYLRRSTHHHSPRYHYYYHYYYYHYYITIIIIIIVVAVAVVIVVAFTHCFCINLLINNC